MLISCPEPFSSESPKLAGARGDIFFRQQESSFAIPCRVQGFPVPEFRSVICYRRSWMAILVVSVYVAKTPCCSPVEGFECINRK